MDVKKAVKRLSQDLQANSDAFGEDMKHLKNDMEQIGKDWQNMVHGMPHLTRRPNPAARQQAKAARQQAKAARKAALATAKVARKAAVENRKKALIKAGIAVYANVKITSRNGVSDVTIDGVTTYGIPGSVSVVDNQIYADGKLIDTTHLSKVNTSFAKRLWSLNAKRNAEAKEDKTYGDIRRNQMASADYRGDSLIDHVKILEDENKALKAAANQEKPKNDARIHDEHLTNFWPIILSWFVFTVIVVAMVIIL